MEKYDIQGIIEQAYGFIEAHSVRGSAIVDDVMMVAPHTHGLDSLLVYIYEKRAETGDAITKLIEARILDLRNEIDILTFLNQADEDSLVRALQAKEDIKNTFGIHYS